MKVVTVNLAPRIYVNSFPKSGTSLANLSIRHIVRHSEEDKRWLGSFHEAWTSKWVSDENFKNSARTQEPGTFTQGHSGYRKEYADVLRQMGFCVLFVYRDLRDVVVSQTYHIESPDDKKFRHAGKDIFNRLPSHEARMLAVIKGIDRFPGIFDRWDLFSPWLEVPWVHPVRYESMRENLAETVEGIIRYILKMSLAGVDCIPVVLKSNVEETIDKTVKLMDSTAYSGTFRKGQVGNWEEEFTPRVKATFKELCGDRLIELGYEEDDDW